jgi:hypothetical protein
MHEREGVFPQAQVPVLRNSRKPTCSVLFSVVHEYSACVASGSKAPSAQSTDLTSSEDKHTYESGCGEANAEATPSDWSCFMQDNECPLKTILGNLLPYTHGSLIFWS